MSKDTFEKLALIFSPKLWSTLNEKNDKIRTREWSKNEKEIYRRTDYIRTEAS